MARRKSTKRAPTKPRGRTLPDWAPAFLTALARDGNVTKACAAAGIQRDTFYKRRDNDDAFRSLLNETLETATDELEQIARDRAKECSDKLLMFLLRAHRRKVYGDRLDIQHGGAITLEIVEEVIDSPQQDNPAAPHAG